MSQPPLPEEQDHNVSLPHARCYWVSPTLLVGAHPSCRHHLGTGDVVDDLLGVGVRVFVDLTTSEDCADYLGPMLGHADEPSLEAVRVGVRDFGTPTVGQVELVLAKVAEAQRTGRTLYLHDHSCGGRTSVMVGCVLAATRSGAEALDRVSELRLEAGVADSPSFDVVSQSEFVLAWADRRRG